MQSARRAAAVSLRPAAGAQLPIKPPSFRVTTMVAERARDAPPSGQWLAQAEGLPMSEFFVSSPGCCTLTNSVRPSGVLSTPVMMAYWFAPPLIVLNGEEPIAAMKKSFRACWVNVGATLVYGLIWIGLAIVASIPFGLGWIVLAPVMAGSWYASWRETFDA